MPVASATWCWQCYPQTYCTAPTPFFCWPCQILIILFAYVPSSQTLHLLFPSLKRLHPFKGFSFLPVCSLIPVQLCLRKASGFPKGWFLQLLFSTKYHCSWHYFVDGSILAQEGQYKKAQDRFVYSADFLQDSGCINTSPDCLIKRQIRCSPVEGGSCEDKALLQSHIRVIHCNISPSSERQPAQEHKVSHRAQQWVQELWPKDLGTLLSLWKFELGHCI